MAYATLAELKTYIGIADTEDDTALQLALDAAEQQVNQFTARNFTEDGSVVARYYFAEDTGYVDIDPITTLTGLVVKVDRAGDGTFEETLVINTDFRVEPLNAVALGKPFTRLVALSGESFPITTYRPGVEVTAKYGYQAAVPAPVKQATLLQASRLFMRKHSPFGIAGTPDLGGSELRLLSKLDPDVESLLRPYRRKWYVA